jgi:hypothetical protein
MGEARLKTTAGRKHRRPNRIAPVAAIINPAEESSVPARPHRTNKMVECDLETNRGVRGYQR